MDNQLSISKAKELLEKGQTDAALQGKDIYCRDSAF